MRIGLLTTSFPRQDLDVPGTFVLGFARALAARGHSLEVLAPEPSDPSYRAPPAWPGVDVHWVSYLPRPLEHTFYGAGVLDNLARDPRAWLGPIPFMVAMARAADRRAAHWDAVVSHWALPCALIAARARRQTGRLLRHLAILHSADVHVIERLPRPFGVAAQVARSAQALVFSSRDLRRRFLSRLDPIARVDVAGRAHVSAMGIEPSPPPEHDRATVRQERGLDSYTLLTVSRLVPIKGLDALIRAVAGLPAVQLVIAGDGPQRSTLAHLARALGARVRFVGEVCGAEKLAWLQAADVFVLSSRKLSNGRTEGMPTSVLEAMARGLPVIATAAGGLADLVQHGENGLLVAPDDLTAMRFAIERLRDAGLRARLAVAALETAQQYLWPVLAPKFEALLTGDSAC